MESPYTVYVHTSPEGKRYVGITRKKVTSRWGRDGKGYKTCLYFWHAVVKYGWDNFQHEVLAENLTESEAKQREKDLIVAYKTRDSLFGYNLTDGGDGLCGWIPSVTTRANMSASHMGKKSNLGHKHTDAARAAMSAAKKGIPKSAETKKKMSAAQMGNQKNLGHKASESARANMRAAKNDARYTFGYKHNDATRAKMSAAQMGNHKALGHKHTTETRAAMSASAKGRKASPATRAAMIAAQRLAVKDVERLTNDGEVIGRYNSLVDAAEKTGIKKNNIWKVCSGKQVTAGGFRWRYIDKPTIKMRGE